MKISQCALVVAFGGCPLAIVKQPKLFIKPAWARHPSSDVSPTSLPSLPGQTRRVPAHAMSHPVSLEFLTATLINTYLPSRYSQTVSVSVIGPLRNRISITRDFYCLRHPGGQVHRLGWTCHFKEISTVRISPR